MSNYHKIRLILNKKEKRNFCILICCSVFLSVSEIFSISILLPIINLFLDPSLLTSSQTLSVIYGRLNMNSPLAFLTVLVVMAILLFLGKSIYGMAVLYLQQKYLSAIQRRIASDILEEYLQRPYEFHLANNSSHLFKNINVEVGQFVAYILNPVITILSESIILCGVLVTAVYLYPKATFASVIFIGAVSLGQHLFFKSRLSQYAENRSVFSEKYYKTVSESLQSVKEVRIFNAKDFFVNRFLYSFERYLDSLVKSNFIGSLPRYYFEMILFAGTLSVILISAYLKTDHTTVLPMIAILGVVAMRLLPTVSKIVSSINSMHYSFNALDMVSSVMSEISENDSKKDTPSSKSFRQHGLPITLDHVSFKYASASAKILQDFNLSIVPRSITALIGETGAGKSTLIDIIMGLLVPQKGGVYYGQELVDEKNADAYRAMIGYVPQNITLLDDTIAANIAFGAERNVQNEEKLLNAVEKAQLKKFIGELPDGIQTPVGERGLRISGGQRQRIGIARALYNDPEILIFDEATSALDVHTEEKIYQLVKELGKTIIVVTHRLTTLAFVDMIYVLERGRVSEMGTYEELNNKASFLTEASFQNHSSQVSGC